MKQIYNLDITIMDPNNYNKIKLYLVAEFVKNNNDYGNGIHLSIKGRGKTSFNQLFDLRYEKLDTQNLELFLATWAYNNWSGSNGSYDIVKLTIENMTIKMCKTA